MFGIFCFKHPSYVITDPELIKQITIKKFDHFVNHNSKVNENVDKIFGKNMVFLLDQKWRDMRATLSPIFTS
jgi:cytochrome P450 family 9